MKIWNLTFFVALFATQSLLASDIIISSPAMVSANSKVVCELNPPTNLTAYNISTSWADLSWTPAAGASQYLIKTFDRMSGLEVHSVIVPGTATTVQVSWPDNCSGNLESKAWSIGSNEEPSNSYTLHPFHAVILELVATGFQFTPGLADGCTVTSSLNSCSQFTWGEGYQTSFTIQPPQNAGVKSTNYTVEGFNDNPNQHIYIRTQQTPGYSYDIFEEKCYVYSQGICIIILEPVYTPNANNPKGYMRRTAYNNAFVITKQGTSASFGPLNPSGASRDSEESIAFQTVTAAPNPFTDLLTVQLPETTNPIGTNVRLYDLLGSVQRTYSVAADLQELTLNTADLTPGVYFLRIESDGHVETIKVLKTQ